MKTIGKTLKLARQKKKLTLSDLEKITKIKSSFIESIEKENWKGLPEYPVVVGFVKSLARSLKINQKKAVALLRRDYPPQSLNLNPKPDVSDKFVWSPRLTFILGTTVTFLVIVSYLVFQYINFISPPKLDVFVPSEGQVFSESEVRVEGVTDSQATITVNNQPALVDEEGKFEVEIDINQTSSTIEVVAKSRAGKETVVRRSIVPELREP